MIELNPKESALLVIDMQLAQRPIFKEAELLEKVNRLIDNALKNEVYTIYIRHAGNSDSDFDPEKPGYQFLPDLKVPSNPIIVQKRQIDSFYQTSIQSLLIAQKIKILVLCGLRTELCFDTAIRVGFHLGYRIVVPEDAHSTQISPHLAPEKIILHHQKIWYPSFVKLAKTAEIKFI